MKQLDLQIVESELSSAILCFRSILNTAFNMKIPPFEQISECALFGSLDCCDYGCDIEKFCRAVAQHPCAQEIFDCVCYFHELEQNIEVITAVQTERMEEAEHDNS